MGSPFKHISQIQSLADFTKLTKQVIGKLGEEPVKVHYFAKFKFDKKEAPLLLIGDLPTPVLVEVKKAAGNPVIGQCSINVANQLVFEGAVKPGVALKALQAAGIQQAVATSGGDDEKEGAPGEKPVEAKKPPVAPAKLAPSISKPAAKLPVAPPKPPVTPVQRPGAAPLPKAPVPEAKGPVPPVKPPTNKPASPATATAPPKAPPLKEPVPPAPASNPAQDFERRADAIIPLFQKALDLPDSPEVDLQNLYKAANEAAAKKDFAAAVDALNKLEMLVGETLARVKTPGEEAADADPEIKGEFAKSRKAWQKAMRDAAVSIGALQAAILKTKDPRATGLASGFKRILKKLPNPVPSLEALALAAEKKDAAAAEKHKVEAKKLANLCTNYLGTDRLVMLATENPFVPIKLVENFKSALQTLNAELK